MDDGPGVSTDSLLRWADLLEALDEAQLAGRLIAHAGAGAVTVTGWPSTVDRARLLLATGDPEAALHTLDKYGTWQPPEEGLGFDDAVLAAAWAMLDHADAYNWLGGRVMALHACVGKNFGSWMLALAADHRGDTATAEQMWVWLAEHTEQITRTSVTRRMVVLAEAALRSLAQAEPPRDVGEVYRYLVSATELLPNPVDRDPRPVLDAAEALCRRLRPRTGPVFVAGAVLFGLLALGATAAGNGKVGIVLFALATLVWTRLVPIPGWTTAETSAYRYLMMVRPPASIRREREATVIPRRLAAEDRAQPCPQRSDRAGDGDDRSGPAARCDPAGRRLAPEGRCLDARRRRLRGRRVLPPRAAPAAGATLRGRRRPAVPLRDDGGHVRRISAGVRARAPGPGRSGQGAAATVRRGAPVPRHRGPLAAPGPHRYRCDRAAARRAGRQDRSDVP